MSSNHYICAGTTKAGIGCKQRVATDGAFCKRHAAYQDVVVDAAAMDAPINSPQAPTLDAPINTKENTMTTEAPTMPTIVAPVMPAPAAPSAPENKKASARNHYESRQRAKRQQIATSEMNSNQKEVARMLLARESDSAPIIEMNVERDDERIMAFDLALKSGDKYTQAIKPADYDKRPRWLDEKTWKKAWRAFNTLYARDGAGAFEKDQDGRLIMPLPMTSARYMGAVISGDIVTVLRFAGAWKESDGATFTMLSGMDGCAPIISAVYRAGASLNRASTLLDKAQEKLDAADVDARDALTTKRDMARIALGIARDSFIRTYQDAIANASELDKKARKDAADMLAAFASDVAPINQEVKTDLVG